MSRPMIEVIFASEKRKDVLLLLRDGPTKIETILEVLETTRPALLPQIRILEDNYLVSHNKDSYKLTNIGELVVEEVVPLLDTVNVFDTDIDYWGTRNLEFLPPYLLERVNELGSCQLVNPDLTEIYTLPQAVYGEFYEPQKHSKVSRSFACITSFFYPNSKGLFSEMIANDVDIYVVATKEVYDKVRAHELADFQEIISSDLFHLHIYPGKIDFMSLGFTDKSMIMRLLNNRKEYDNTYIVSSSSSALQWAKELYEYYLEASEPFVRN